MSGSYDGPERRDLMESFNERRTTLRREDDRAGCPYLTPEQMEEIADKAAERAAVRAVELMTNKIYMEVGKSVIKKVTIIIGAAAVALSIWLYGKGTL